MMAGQLGWMSGCAVNPELVEVERPVEVPLEWRTAEAKAGEVPGWVSEFGDAELEAVVWEALGRNYEVRGAAARLERSRAAARIAGAGQLPELSLVGSGQRQSTRTVGDPSLSVRQDRFEVGALASWEVDLWGRVRAGALAGQADALVAEGEYAALRRSLAAQTAGAYFEVVASEEQVGLLEETLATFESSLATVEERFERGLTPALDVQLARANVASARANRVEQEIVKERATRRLEVLAGRYPAGQAAVAGQLPRLGEAVPAGLPSDLLRRRPDLLAAEFRVVAEEARVRESRRALLPSFALTAQYGRASEELGDLLEDSFDVWSLLGNLSAPLFQGGRLRAAVDRSEAVREESLAQYGQALLTAFEEVETGLVSESLLRDRLEAVEEAAEESLAAQELAEERYERGLVDIITVLEAQRRAFTARSTVISVKNELLQNRLSLVLALGGELR